MFRNNWSSNTSLGKFLQQFQIPASFTYNVDSFKLSLKKTGIGAFW